MPADSWTLLPDATPAIIKKELFDRVQAALVRSKELHPGKATHGREGRQDFALFLCRHIEMAEGRDTTVR
jgi:hypothetical protein